MITKDINIKDIKIVENIRREVKDEKEMPYLMQSIKDNGLLQPIGVKEDKVGYTLVWGFRRMQACKKLGYKDIPAVIFVNKNEELTEEEFFLINATENIQRKPNTLLEFGRVCKILRKTMSASEIAAKLGVPKTRVDSALVEISRIPLKWHKKIQMVGAGVDKKGDIPLSTASVIGRLRNVTTTQKEQLLNWVSKDDTGLNKLTKVASLMRNGMGFKEAKNDLEKYRNIAFTFFVDTEKYQKFKEQQDSSDIDIMVKALNRFAGETIAIPFANKIGVHKR